MRSCNPLPNNLDNQIKDDFSERRSDLDSYINENGFQSSQQQPSNQAELHLPMFERKNSPAFPSLGHGDMAEALKPRDGAQSTVVIAQEFSRMKNHDTPPRPSKPENESLDRVGNQSKQEEDELIEESFEFISGSGGGNNTVSDSKTGHTADTNSKSSGRVQSNVKEEISTTKGKDQSMVFVRRGDRERSGMFGRASPQQSE